MAFQSLNAKFKVSQSDSLIRCQDFVSFLRNLRIAKNLSIFPILLLATFFAAN